MARSTPSRRDLAFTQEAALLRMSDEQEIGYLASIFAQLSLPYRDPGNEPAWARRNGRLTLIVQPGQTLDAAGNPHSIGYPYGTVPRLLLTWMSTEAVRTKSPVLEVGTSLAAFMRNIGLQPTGGAKGSINRVRNQTLRLLEATLSVRVDDETPRTAGRTRDTGARITIATAYDLWWATDRAPGQMPLIPSQIRLSSEFFDEVTTHPVPLDMGALRALRGSALRLDVYVWLLRRMSYLAHPTTVPWTALQGQFGSQLADTPQGRNQFRRDFTAHLRRVLAVYPDAKVEATESGIMLKPSKTLVPMRGMRELISRTSRSA